MAYLRTDERHEAIKGLEFLLLALEKAQADEYYWKWVIIALQNTVQAFIVCALSGTAGIGALKKDCRIKTLKALESGSGEYIKPELDSFLNLYSRVKTELNFVSTKEIDKDINRIRDFRNDFLHFAPQGWSIEISGLPRMTRNCMKVVGFLGWKPGNFRWNNDEKKTATHLHSKIVEFLDGQVHVAQVSGVV